jgi:hypothetical protein
MAHTNQTIVALLILALTVITLLARRRLAVLAVARRARPKAEQFANDLLVCDLLVGDGLCSLATVRTALQYKASGVSAGRMTSTTSVAQILLNQGAITKQQADQAARRSQELLGDRALSAASHQSLALVITLCKR